MKSEEGDERFQNMARTIQSGYGVVKIVLGADRQNKKAQNSIVSFTIVPFSFEKTIDLASNDLFVSLIIVMETWWL